ncbi:MAG: c-type cytochrome, partial [Gammaproteobacteria bacterium]
KIYDRAFGRGCGACHDVSPNPNLFENIKKGSLTKEIFVEVLNNGRNGMPPAVDAIMKVGPVKKAKYTKEQAIDAIYNYLAGRADGSVPAGKLKQAK